MNRVTLAALAAVLLTALAPIASAQEEEARHHFRLGQAHYESGHFVEAAQEFEESYRLSGRATLLHNIYVAYRDAGEIARAADALRRYLATAPDIDNETVLRRRLATLERMIEQGQTRAALGGDDDDGSAPAAAAAPVTATTAAPASSSGGGGPSPVGFVVAGIGAAAIVGGIVTGAMALSVQDELAATCGPERLCPPGYDFQTRVSSGDTLAIVTDVLLPVGVAAAAAGVVLMFVLTEGGSSEAPAASAFCGPDGCMGVVRARF